MTTPLQDRLFAIAWRVALLALPWQARFILSTPQLNGFPWEQGTAALYVSWIPLLATIVLAWGSLKAWAVHAPRSVLVLVPVAVLAGVSLFSSFGAATIRWWIHVVLLGLFAAALLVRHVPPARFAGWFVFSIVPHAVLGVVQFAAQHVWGSTLLGMAEHFSSESGVSVVEHSEYRVLRVYGGFPHPNVFAGWLVIATACVPGLIRRAQSMAAAFVWILCGTLFLYTLVLTFSRGAWIAAAVSVPIAFVLAFRAVDGHPPQRKAFVYTFVLFASAVLICTATQWETVSARFRPTERLERWSLVQRTSAIHDGFQAFARRPIVGWGPGAGLVGVGVVRTVPAPIPLEPPHVVPFVMLVEVGLLGFAAVVSLLVFLLRPFFSHRRWSAVLPLLSALAILAMTDHYVWTLWAGNTLFFAGLFLLWCADTDRDFSTP